jgi:hypothetical protein
MSAVTATSQLPAVKNLVSQLSAQGKLLDKAYVDNNGKITAYQARGETLTIVIGQDNSSPINAGILGDDPATGLQNWYQNQQLLQYARIPPFNPRLLYFGIGVAALIMATIYIRRGKT